MTLPRRRRRGPARPGAASPGGRGAPHRDAVRPLQQQRFVALRRRPQPRLALARRRRRAPAAALAAARGGLAAGRARRGLEGAEAEVAPEVVGAHPALVAGAGARGGGRGLAPAGRRVGWERGRGRRVRRGAGGGRPGFPSFSLPCAAVDGAAHAHTELHAHLTHLCRALLPYPLLAWLALLACANGCRHPRVPIRVSSAVASAAWRRLLGPLCACAADCCAAPAARRTAAANAAAAATAAAAV
jgi:hypothetical protein